MGNSVLLFESGENTSCFDFVSSSDNAVICFLTNFGDASKIRISMGDTCDCNGSFDTDPSAVVTLEFDVLQLLSSISYSSQLASY